MLSELHKMSSSQNGIIDFTTVRIRFRKVGSMQYISHLDLQRTLGRVFVRAGLPLWFTKGFNPHPKLNFAMPLSVGTQSECELLDLRFKKDADVSDVMARMNRQLTDELRVLEVYEPTTKFSDIAYAAYEFEIHTTGADQALADRIYELLHTAPLMMTKRTKSGEKEMDIIPQIRRADVCYDADDDCIRIAAELSATTDNFLNPELVMTALAQHCGIMQGDPMKEYYTIVRRRILTAEGEDFR